MSSSIGVWQFLSLAYNHELEGKNADKSRHNSVICSYDSRGLISQVFDKWTLTICVPNRDLASIVNSSTLTHTKVA